MIARGGGELTVDAYGVCEGRSNVFLLDLPGASGYFDHYRAEDFSIDIS